MTRRYFGNNLTSKFNTVEINDGGLAVEHQRIAAHMGPGLLKSIEQQSVFEAYPGLDQSYWQGQGLWLMWTHKSGA